MNMTKETCIETAEAVRADNARYLQAMMDVEAYCQVQGLNHRFVGGTVTDLFVPHLTPIIDVEDRTVYLREFNAPTLIRADGTVKDIDLVIFGADYSGFRVARQEFARWRKEAVAEGLPYPKISAEAARYPSWPRIKRWKQFVTAFSVNDQNVPSLDFGKIHQPITWQSLEPWTVRLGTDSNSSAITSFNPMGHALCYVLRVPSGVKKKDKEIVGEGTERYSKMSLVMELGGQTWKEGKAIGLDFRGEDYFKPWVTYIQTLLKHPDALTRIKALITGPYWDNLGTRFSHGNLPGPFKKVADLSDRFAG